MRVVEVWRHPVKSMQGERVATAEIDERGLAGDRRWGVRDTETGKVLSAKREGRLLEAAATLGDGGVPEVRLPDGSVFAASDPKLDTALSAWLGRDVRVDPADDVASAAYGMNVSNEDETSPTVEIMCPPGTFLDGPAIHVLSTASLAAAGVLHPSGQWDVRRFRPTLLVEADDDGFAEDAWIGSALHVGGAELFVFAPTVRCAMPARAQPGGITRDLEIVKTVNRHHGSNLGVYAAVRAPGRVAKGDDVVLVPA